MAIDIIARGMIESSKSDISQLFDITKGGEIASNESSYTLNNAVDYPLLGLNLYGKSTQDGTPTPENPVDIVSVGDSGAVGIAACGKNLFPWNDYTETPIMAWGHSALNKTNKEINYSANEKSLNNSGIRISHDAFDKYFPALLSGITFTISCEMRADIDATVWFGMQRSSISNCNVNSDWKKYTCITSYNDDSSCQLVWSMRNLRQTSTLYIRNIQIEIGDTATAYEPYKGATASITSALPLCGIPVSEGGNYTDGNGQQWVCDELIYNADGTGKIIKRLGSFTIDGTEKFKIYDSTASKEIAIVSEKYNEIKQPKSVRSVPIIISDILSSDTAENVWDMAKDNIIGIHYESVENKDSLRIYSTYFSSAAVAKSFFTDNPKNIIAELAEPQEIELTAAEMAQLRELQTFDGITNITNGSGADMDVKICTNKMLAEYVFPITTGLQAQIDELKAAVISLGGNV